MADGSLKPNGRLVLTESAKDKQHLEIFAKFIDCPMYGDNASCKGKIYPQYRVAAMNVKWAKLFRSKFDFNHNKTLNPPKTVHFNNTSLFLSFLIGYIDGDGSINKQSGRQDCIIRIQVHSGWQKLLQLWINELVRIAEVPFQIVKINKRGYTFVALANQKLVLFLKKQAVKLPVLNRKWDLITGESLQ